MNHYIAALCELVTTCAFSAFENEMLHDQLIEKTSMPHIHERLLLESDLALDKALGITRQNENAIAEYKIMLDGEPESRSAVQPKTSKN